MAIIYSEFNTGGKVRLPNGSILSTIYGVDDGTDFAVNAYVIREQIDDGDTHLRLANSEEIRRYLGNKADQEASDAAAAAEADLKAKASAAAGVQGGLPEIKAYLQAKFPADFA